MPPSDRRGHEIPCSSQTWLETRRWIPAFAGLTVVVVTRVMTHQVHIIGGGLAGSEAAWQLAEAGVAVRLSEMRGSGETTPAHQGDGLAELVCSNSFRSDDAENNAVGLLHAEMRALGSLIMAAADAHRVPAGSALAVDRDGFSDEVTARLAAHPRIEIVRERIDALPATGLAIVATGPLT